jgi:hypothetical protein
MAAVPASRADTADTRAIAAAIADMPLRAAVPEFAPVRSAELIMVESREDIPHAARAAPAADSTAADSAEAVSTAAVVVAVDAKRGPLNFFAIQFPCSQRKGYEYVTKRENN